MQHLFVYGSLKQGYANAHVNTGRPVAGRFRTREPFVLCLHALVKVAANDEAALDPGRR